MWFLRSDVFLFVWSCQVNQSYNILYKWFCHLIFILIYRGSSVDHPGIVIITCRLVYRTKREVIIFGLEKSTLENLDLIFFFNKRTSYEFSLHNSNYIESELTISFWSVSYHHLHNHLSSFYKIVFIQIRCVGAPNYKLTSVFNCCRKASVNLIRYSEFIYTDIVGDIGESNDSINGILL